MGSLFQGKSSFGLYGMSKIMDSDILLARPHPYDHLGEGMVHVIRHRIYIEYPHSIRMTGEVYLAGCAILAVLGSPF
jgi:hypothetical protein